jgi:UDP-N-acetylglucosamine--N-acetylmuramyl-(pentapeptide) pyrophosphoryl-undecaprenol N-acetylglucosamine transferase
MSAAPIMIMAGGTGGHVFPGLAVAEALRAREQRVVWLGTHRGLEAEVVPKNGFDIEWISISGVRGRGALAWLAAPFRIVWAVLQAVAVMHRQKPGAVLGLGGFVAGPGGLAAWLTRRPLLIQEQNAVAGTTNRILARFARRVFAAFPGSFPASVQAEIIGNPLRGSIVAHAQTERPGQGKLRLLVLGGSQGARVLNETVPRALARLPEALRPRVVHQAGRLCDAAVAAYRDAGVEATCHAFIDDMAAAYADADLVVARAGALTLAELAAAGIGAVLVPLPHAIDDHQMKNAAYFAANGAAIVLPQSELDAELLARELESLLGDRQRLAEMARHSRGLASTNAAERLAEACIESSRRGR